MASPCVITYNGKDYTLDEFMKEVQSGLPKAETETAIDESKIKELEDQAKQLKLDFFNDKITTQEYNKRLDVINAQIETEKKGQPITKPQDITTPEPTAGATTPVQAGTEEKGIKSSFDSNIESLINPKTGLGATVTKIIDEARPFMDKFLSKKGITLDEYKKFSNEKKDSFNKEWRDSVEYEELNKKNDDKENQKGLQGDQRVGQEPKQGQPVQEGGGETTQASGVLQAQEEVDNEKHPKYDEALKAGQRLGSTSIQSIQRRLNIPYNEAKEIIRQLKRDGMISAPEGSNIYDVKVEELPTQEQPSAGKEVDSQQKLDALDKDIEAMKVMSDKDLAEKKFVGMVARAWEAKNNGEISGPIYTAFRNRAQQVLEGKVKAGDSVKATEAKLAVAKAMGKVKERLLGKGYQNMALSAPLPVSPKTVADIIDFATKLAQRGIEAGMNTAEAFQKAMKVVKAHPAYKKLVASKELDEKVFDAQMEKAQFEIEKATEPEPKTETKETPSSTEEAFTDGTAKKKTLARLEEAPQFKEVIKNIDKGSFYYSRVSKAKVVEHVNEMLDAVAAKGELDKLAESIVNGQNPFHPKVQQIATHFLADRLRAQATNSPPAQADMLNMLAAKLEVYRSIHVNVAATVTMLEGLAAETLPLSEEGLKQFFSSAFETMQKSNMTTSQKETMSQAYSSIQEALATEEGMKAIRKAVQEEADRIAKALAGDDFLAKMNEAKSKLKVDLSEC